MEGQYHVLTRITGNPDALWLVHDGRQEWGPYTTEQLIQMLYGRQVDWLWNVWREGMEKWTPAGRLFTNHEIDGQPIRLREHGYYEVPKPPRKGRK